MEAVHKTTGGELINIDGKTLRGAKEAGNSRSLIHMVSVWSATQHLVIGEQNNMGLSLSVTAICFQTRHKLKYKTRCGASPCDPSCGGFDRVLL